MQTFAIAVLAATASAVPLAVRQEIVGGFGSESKMVNGPTAISSPNVNNGAQDEGVLKDSTSFDGALIEGATGNSLTNVNTNTNLHDNVFQNANINAADGSVGGAVVGNGNQVFRRQAVDASSVNAPAAVNDPVVNNGALDEGTLDAGLSFDGADISNPLGNSLTQVNDNTEVADNNFVDPNWNQISNNNGPAMAGNDNTFIPIDNSGMIVNLDPGFLAEQHAQQAALINHFTGHGFF